MIVLAFFFSALIIVLFSGFPIAFSFLFVDLLAMLIFMGPESLGQITLHMFSSLASFTLTPIAMFVLMGELMFHSRIAYNSINVLDKCLGRMNGRLSIVAASSGLLFSAMSGSTLANTAMLGSSLVPEMERRGYKPAMSIGPIMGVGGLAMLVPPSNLAVVLASIGQISVGKILIGGVLPGILLGMLYALYIVGRCRLNPSLAPRYDVSRIPLNEKIIDLIRYVLPLGLVIFMVLGFILLGIATPTEAGATGALGTIILAIFYRRLNRKVIKASLIGTLHITVMIFTIIAGSSAFSNILAYTGATNELLTFVKNLNVPPIVILFGMQAVIFMLGSFMETISIIMICMPIFMPIAAMLHFDPVWFGILILLNLEMGQTTPPFGMLLFVMKGVVPNIRFGEIILSALPFIGCDMVIMIILIIWPQLV
ncbi:MAG: TRAP transporter large permease subunit, partial [Syntrophaceae bacterium]|nr:TRAP transporter large permease subunit [Syntrophaceae bacterium]